MQLDFVDQLRPTPYRCSDAAYCGKSQQSARVRQPIATRTLYFTGITKICNLQVLLQNDNVFQLQHPVLTSSPFSYPIVSCAAVRCPLHSSSLGASKFADDMRHALWRTQKWVIQGQESDLDSNDRTQMQVILTLQKQTLFEYTLVIASLRVNITSIMLISLPLKS